MHFTSMHFTCGLVWILPETAGGRKDSCLCPQYVSEECQAGPVAGAYAETMEGAAYWHAPYSLLSLSYRNHHLWDATAHNGLSPPLQSLINKTYIQATMAYTFNPSPQNLRLA